LALAHTRQSLFPLVRHVRKIPEVPALVFGYDLGLLLLAAKRMGLIRSRLIYREGSSPRANIKRWLYWTYRVFIRYADLLIAQSRSTSQELQCLGVPSSKIRVIPNPCFQMSAKSTVETAGEPLLLAVGRLSPEKGFDRLIRSFRSLLRSKPRAKLVI